MQMGGAVGLAVLATLATDHTHNLRAAGEPAAEALNAGFHLAYLVGAALVVGALGVALAALRRAERRPGTRFVARILDAALGRRPERAGEAVR